MSWRLLFYSLILCLFISANPVSACRYLTKEAKTDFASSIVIGKAYCTRLSSKCNVRVLKVSKGDELEKGEIFQLSVKYNPILTGDLISVGCGYPSWPEDGSFKTEFYLQRLPDGSFSVLGSLNIKEDKADVSKNNIEVSETNQ